MSVHSNSVPYCGSSESKMTKSFQTPRGFSAHVCVVMNGHLVKPSWLSSSLGRRLRIIELWRLCDYTSTASTTLSEVTPPLPVIIWCLCSSIFINQLKKVLSKILRGTLCEFYKLFCKEKDIVYKLTSSPLI